MYICKSCDKEMFSVTQFVERGGEIYCKQCDPKASARTSPTAKNTTQQSESSEPESKHAEISEDQVLAIFEKKMAQRGWPPEMERLVREDFKRGLNEKKQEEKKQGCVIATAACGSAAAPAVMTLRDFRDTVLVQRHIGRLVIQSYNRIAPSLARRIEPSQTARTLIRTFLVVPMASLIRYLRN
jgi:hypothetical protein